MRLTLAGGGSDVLWYSRLKGGAWISAAINKYLYCVLSENEDGNKLRVYDGDNVEVVKNYKKLENPVIRECFAITKAPTGINLTIISDVSSKSGLGGSGSLEVGLIHALYAYKKRHVSKLELAEKACIVEMAKLKMPVGPQDQYIAALGGIKYFEIDRRGRVTFESLQLSDKTLAKLSDNLLFFRTGIQRSASYILGDQKKKAQMKDTRSQKVIQALNDIKILGQRAKEYLLEGKVDDFGATFHEHWLIKKRLSKKVTSTKIDYWYNQAIKAGALGGKIMGAGGGGWFVFYVPKNHKLFIQKMEKIGLKVKKVAFEWKGTKLLTS